MNAQARPGTMLTDGSRDALLRAMEQVNSLVLGKAREVDWPFACLLAGGHLLIEICPIGKTAGARPRGNVGMSFQPHAFTADLLPSTFGVLDLRTYLIAPFSPRPGVHPTAVGGRNQPARRRAPRAPCSRRWLSISDDRRHLPCAGPIRSSSSPRRIR